MPIKEYGEFQVCSICGENKPISEYYKDKRREGRYYARCKACHNKSCLKWMDNNQERVKEVSKKWVEANRESVRKKRKKNYLDNKDLVIKQCAQYYIENKEYVTNRNKEYVKSHRNERTEWQRKYRKENKEELNKKRREYFKLHPEISMTTTENRRARKINAPGNGWTRKQIKNLKEEYGHRCAYCGAKTKRIEIDHIVPLSRGGAHDIGNAVPACKSCNCRKSNKPLLVWMWSVSNG